MGTVLGGKSWVSQRAQDPGHDAVLQDLGHAVTVTLNIFTKRQNWLLLKNVQGIILIQL